jgi:release factor glutamine methyltransferase
MTAADGTLKWRELLEETISVVGSRPSARWLCEEASGYFGDEFVSALETPATKRCVAHLDSMIARVRGGEPLQYVLGHWAFRNLDLMVDQRVLIPRPETELIVDIVLELLPNNASRSTVVDLGTGSGAIGLSLAMELPKESAEIWITDASEDALEVARANLAGIGTRASSVKVATGDWYSALPSSLRGQVDVVVSNPPYIAEGDPEVEDAVHRFEPHGALYSGTSGLDAIALIVRDSREWLTASGVLVVEIGYQHASSVIELALSAGFSDVEVRCDLTGRDRFLVARLKD